MKSRPYMNPYFAGFLLGMVLLASIYITGRGLGASGAMKSVVATTVRETAPEHYESKTVYREYEQAHPEGPMKSWLVFEVLGVLVGAFFFGVINNRVSLKLEKGLRTSNTIRFGAAVF